MRGIKADWGQHRQQLVLKIIARPVGLRFGPRLHAVKVDPFAFQRGKHGVLEHDVLLMDQAMRAFDHEVVHMLQRHAVGRERARVVAHLFLHAGHADFKKFVQVAAGNTDKAEPFEQRNGGIGGLRQYTFVKTQNAQFAIKKGIA
jgi:hypothetical protein